MGVYGNQAPRRRGALASSLRGKGPGHPTPAPCWALVLVARSSPTLNWLEGAPLAARKEDPRNSRVSYASASSALGSATLTLANPVLSAIRSPCWWLAADRQHAPGRGWTQADLQTTSQANVRKTMLPTL